MNSLQVIDVVHSKLRILRGLWRFPSYRAFFLFTERWRLAEGRGDLSVLVLNRVNSGIAFAEGHAVHAMLRSDSSFMLVELRAENYAVIDHAIAVFGPGLNLLTGETGAGKSILVDALALLMGGKASTEIVRHGAEKAVVACVFESTRRRRRSLRRTGSMPRGTRSFCGARFCRPGKGRVFVNNQPATVAVLRQLAPELALVHAQSETLASFDQTQQRILLDRFAGISTEDVATAYECMAHCAGRSWMIC